MQYLAEHSFFFEHIRYCNKSFPNTYIHTFLITHQLYLAGHSFPNTYIHIHTYIHTYTLVVPRKELLSKYIHTYIHTYIDTHQLYLARDSCPNTYIHTYIHISYTSQGTPFSFNISDIATESEASFPKDDSMTKTSKPAPIP